MDKKNLLFCTTENKRNMWIYYYCANDTLFIFDPITPKPEIIKLIADFKAKEIYLILTACQHKKKFNLKLWRHIFPKAKIIAPDKTFIPNEQIFENDSITSFNQDIIILNSEFLGMHILCVKIFQFLFIGELSQPHNGNFKISETINQFCTFITYNTIVLPSFGPINIISGLDIFKEKKYQLKQLRRKRRLTQYNNE